MKFLKGPWELSENNTSLWVKSPWNARVKIANIIQHAPMNGIDHNANAIAIQAVPDMVALLEEIDTALATLWIGRDHGITPQAEGAIKKVVPMLHDLLYRVTKNEFYKPHDEKTNLVKSLESFDQIKG